MDGIRQRPILFQGAMVRALLDGSKTQTRRVCKNRIYANGFKFDGHDFLCHNDYLPPSATLMDVKRGGIEYTTSDHEGWESECPYGQPGDRLWVRETWSEPTSLDPGPTFYRADYPANVPSHFQNVLREDQIKWRPSIHMRRDQSRITLEITGVRVERLQRISEADAIAEGIERDVQPGDPAPLWRNYKTSNTTISPVYSYETLWESINGAESWDANPWVWVVEFKAVKP